MTPSPTASGSSKEAERIAHRLFASQGTCQPSHNGGDHSVDCKVLAGEIMALIDAAIAADRLQCVCRDKTDREPYEGKDGDEEQTP